MLKNWAVFTQALSYGSLKELCGATPEVMKNFSAMWHADLKIEALETKNKRVDRIGNRRGYSMLWMSSRHPFLYHEINCHCSSMGVNAGQSIRNCSYWHCTVAKRAKEKQRSCSGKLSMLFRNSYRNAPLCQKNSEFADIAAKMLEQWESGLKIFWVRL